MDLPTRQAIIKKINDCPVDHLRRKMSGYEDDEIERFRRLCAGFIDNMTDDRDVLFHDRDTGFEEMLRIDVNRVLLLFDPIDGLEG